MNTLMLDYIKSQIAIHGHDYVDELFNSKFVPVLTDRGWRWLYVSNDDYADWVKNLEQSEHSVVT